MADLDVAVGVLAGGAAGPGHGLEVASAETWNHVERRVSLRLVGQVRLRQDHRRLHDDVAAVELAEQGARQPDELHTIGVR